MRLGRVNQKRVTQIHCAGLTCRERDPSIRGSVQLLGKLDKGQARNASRLENARHVEVRTDSYSRRRVVVFHVGKKE